MSIRLEPSQRRDLLLEQYREAPRMVALIDGLLAILQEELAAPAATLSRYASPDEAEGVWLDRLGDRLGLTRPTVESGTVGFFGFDGAGATFDQAPLYITGAEAQILAPIGDDWYRRLLHARALFIRGGASRDDVAEALTALFGDGGARIDEGDLTVTIDVSAEDDVYYAAVETRTASLIPRPAGVAMTLTRTHRRLLADAGTGGDTVA